MAVAVYMTENICEQIARTVSFSGENAYIEMDPISIESQYSMSMRVKSTNNDGLIFYTSDDRPAQVKFARTPGCNAYISMETMAP